MIHRHVIRASGTGDADKRIGARLLGVRQRIARERLVWRDGKSVLRSLHRSIMDTSAQTIARLASPLIDKGWTRQGEKRTRQVPHKRSKSDVMSIRGRWRIKAYGLWTGQCESGEYRCKRCKAQQAIANNQSARFDSVPTLTNGLFSIETENPTATDETLARTFYRCNGDASANLNACESMD